MKLKRFIKYSTSLLVLCVALIASACGSDEPNSGGDPVKPDPNPGEVTVGPPEGKAVYIPQELRTMDLKNKNSKWYWGRTKCTDDVILFWAKGFGDDLSKAPSLEGQNMKVDADRLLSKVQEFYDYYYNVEC